MIAFVQAKIQKLDNANKPPNAITESLHFASGPVASIHLGSPKKVEKKVVQETVTEFAAGLGTRQFRGMLEEFLNDLYEDNELPRDGYIAVKGSQLVISKLLLVKTSCLFIFYRFKNSSIWKSTTRMWLTGNSALIASAAINPFMVMKGVTMSLFNQRIITFLHAFFDFSSLQ